MKQLVTVGAQLLWGGRYGCNNGRYGCTIVMSYAEINKAVSQWLLTFNLCVSVTWPLTCAFHIPCTHTPEIIDMHRGVCDKSIKHPHTHTYIFCANNVQGLFIVPIIINVTLFKINPHVKMRNFLLFIHWKETFHFIRIFYQCHKIHNLFLITPTNEICSFRHG